MIDLHAHIIPGIDDGAKDLEEALFMAREAVREGIETIVATPHHANGKYWNEAGDVQRSLERLNEALAAEGIPLKALPGQEVRVYEDLIGHIQDGTVMTLARSSYILLEFPTGSIPQRMEDTIHELLLLGITPIIAHPERNMELTKEPAKLQRLIEIGALSQITSHSINGLFGNKIREHALRFCEWNLAHFIASDAHNGSQRAFGLARAYETVNERFGEEKTCYYRGNARSVIESAPIDILQPSVQERRWFYFWK